MMDGVSLAFGHFVDRVGPVCHAIGCSVNFLLGVPLAALLRECCVREN